MAAIIGRPVIVNLGTLSLISITRTITLTSLSPKTNKKISKETTIFLIQYLNHLISHW